MDKLKLHHNVIARVLDYDRVGYFYRGIMTKKLRTFCRVTLFNNNKVYRVSKDMVFRLKSFSSEQLILQGDYVLAAVSNDNNEECFVPGLVQSIRTNVEEVKKRNEYLILYFNGQYGENLGCQLIKISRGFYGEVVNHIFNNMLEDNRILSLRPYFAIKEKEIDLLNFVNESIANQVKSSVSKSFDNLELGTKYHELIDKIQEINTANIEQKAAISTSIEILEEINTENVKSKLFHESFATQIKNEMKRIRKSLPKLEKNDDCLAKWKGDGWYYFGIIKEMIGKYSYIVVDVNKYEETIAREDIVSFDQSLTTGWEKHDAVIAPHPAYSYSYAPGIVMDSIDLFNIKIRFYDGVEGSVKIQDALYIGLCKFEADVTKIVKIESGLINKVVIAKNTLSGRYEEGTIKEKMTNQRGYVVQFDSESVIVDDISDMIFKDEKNQNLLFEIMDCVLAKKKSDEKAYYIGAIIEKEGINYSISFYDGTIVKDVNFTNNDIYKLRKSDCKRMSSFYKNSDKKQQNSE